MSGHWQKLTELPHDCSMGRPDPRTVGMGSVWACDCGIRFTVRHWLNGDADYVRIMPDGICAVCLERPSENPPRWTCNGGHNNACKECADRFDADKREHQAIERENQ